MICLKETNKIKANKLLEEIKYNKLENEKYLNLPYTKLGGAFMSLPLLHYLFEIKAYISYASGPTDFGIMNKSMFNIPKDSLVQIKPINETKTEIKWIEKPNILFDILFEALCLTNYDFRLFELLNFKINKTIVEMNFTVQTN